VTWYLDAALVAGAAGLVTGAFVPHLIARVPEPEPDPVLEPAAERTSGPVSGQISARTARAGSERDGEVAGVSGTDAEPDVEQPKELYVDLAARPGLRWKTSVATAVVAGMLGARLGFHPALALALYLAPVGVTLALIDWRTRLLPTRLIAPSYAVVVVLVVLAALLDGDRHALVTAGLGWLVAGGTFFVLWFAYPRGMGYGDVRLSGVLGIALGYLGWPELLTGVYAGFLLGGVGGLLLSLLRLVDRKAYPFGPFMLVGAVVGVLAGPYVGALYA
jgi:leader peptidase (prepilin peptidase) / N-methyltransferase